MTIEMPPPDPRVCGREGCTYGDNGGVYTTYAGLGTHALILADLELHETQKHGNVRQPVLQKEKFIPKWTSGLKFEGFKKNYEDWIKGMALYRGVTVENELLLGEVKRQLVEMLSDDRIEGKVHSYFKEYVMNNARKTKDAKTIMEKLEDQFKKCQAVEDRDVEKEMWNFKISEETSETIEKVEELRERLGPSLKKEKTEVVKEDILDRWIIQKVVE